MKSRKDPRLIVHFNWELVCPATRLHVKPADDRMVKLRAAPLCQLSDDPDDKPCMSPTVVSVARQHYDPSREIVLRSEFLPERQFKVCSGGRQKNTSATPWLQAEPLSSCGQTL